VSHELVDLSSWDSLCPVNGQFLCVVGIHVQSDVMNELAKTFAKDHLRFMHLSGASEKNDVFATLEAASANPSLLVVNRKRTKMAIGGPSKSFLDTIISGSGKWIQEPKLQ
jgi:hypothetical protein